MSALDSASTPSVPSPPDGSVGSGKTAVSTNVGGIDALALDAARMYVRAISDLGLGPRDARDFLKRAVNET